MTTGARCAKGGSGRATNSGRPEIPGLCPILRFLRRRRKGRARCLRGLTKGLASPRPDPEAESPCVRLCLSDKRLGQGDGLVRDRVSAYLDYRGLRTLPGNRRSRALFVPEGPGLGYRQTRTEGGWGAAAGTVRLVTGNCSVER